MEGPLYVNYNSLICRYLGWRAIAQGYLDKSNVFQQQLSPTPINDGNGDWHAEWNVPAGLANGADYTVVVKDDVCVVDSHSPRFAVLDTVILGDLNGTGAMDADDVQSFVNALLGM